jgi:hypothetical protein
MDDGKMGVGDGPEKGKPIIIIREPAPPQPQPGSPQEPSKTYDWLARSLTGFIKKKVPSRPN